MRKIKSFLAELNNPQNSLIDIKELLLKYIIYISFILIFPAIVVAIIEATMYKHYVSVAFYCFIYLLFLCNHIFYKFLFYKLKTIILLFALFLIVVHNFSLWGISGAAIPIALLMIILTTILFGIKHGFVAVGISLIPMVIIGFLMVTHIIEITVDVMTMSSSGLSWLTAAVVLSIISFVSILSFGLVEMYLVNSSKFIKLQSEKLKDSNVKLNDDIQQRKEIEDRLRRRIDLDSILNNISTELININPGNFENKINEILSELGQHGGYEYIFFSIYNDSKTECKMIFTYSSDKNSEITSNISNIPPTVISENIKGINLNSPIFIKDFKDLNTPIRESFEKKVMILPLIFKKDNVGLIGVKNENGSEFEHDDIFCFMTVKNILTNLIIHQKTEMENVKIQEQLIQSQKLESIGNLAAGISHDFNNLLTVILGNSEVLKYRLQKIGYENDLIDDIITASLKASELTQKMLLFSRKQKMEFAPINLNQCILDLKKILERLIGENIQIATNLEDNLPSIQADKNNIEQVILNIAANTRDAFNDNGGNFIISTTKKEFTNKSVNHVLQKKSGEVIELSMEDDGCGIDASLLDKIFDPFFTTKEVGKGTGMGLSVVYGIVKKHGGWIEVKSTVGAGTVFKIFLPIVKNNPFKFKPQLEESLPEIGRRDEKLLIVEDNDGVLQFSKKLLSEYGFDIDIAQNGKEAQRLFESNNHQYDMVISDIILPDINGVDLVEDFKVKNNSLKILMISGYANEKARKKIKENDEIFFLAKPFKNFEFIRKVYSVLDNKI